jgi:ribonuclease VapC
MILDSSALIAILRDEPEAATYAEAIEHAHVRRLSAASYVETGAVIDRANDPIVSRRLDELIALAHIQLETVTGSQARIAREAYRDFGKGSGHPAGLNFGDCFSYALAKSNGEPLLYKGEDFIHTDL